MRVQPAGVPREHAARIENLASTAPSLDASCGAPTPAKPFTCHPIATLTRTPVVGACQLGTVLNTEAIEGFCTILCEVPLNAMFGYSSDLRSETQGKGEFTMEFQKYEPVLPQDQALLIKAYETERAAKK